MGGTGLGLYPMAGSVISNTTLLSTTTAKHIAQFTLFNKIIQ